MKTIPEITIQNCFTIPVLGLGTWEMGGRSSADKSEDNKWIHAIEFAIESGIRHIDTAAIYGAGHAERLVGQAIKNFDRKNLIITTKVSGDTLQFHQVLRSADDSRKRMGIDQIDLFLLHWPNPSVPLGQTMSAVNKLLEDRSVKYFGLSNFPVALINEVGFYTDAPIITNQLEYNLMNRNQGSYNQNVETEIIPYCLKKGVSITAWRPVMKGDASAIIYPLLQSLAEKYDKTVFQIALNWLISKPSMLAIPKMTSEAHIMQNIDATQFEIDQDDMLLLDNIKNTSDL
ncbi:MAG: aldo/keto reductase [Bacteroidetes bacterium HGW-Bacteroidetes-1]|jgi:diketogulonate reductase-like aldo/keto reductase|nr:MAG: aldo/keto reductase [Bacteroidetes bacterium HGW-Bacteroidetes-1]